MKRKLKAIIKYFFLSVLTICLCGGTFLLSYTLSLDEWKEFDPKSVRENLSLSTTVYDRDGQTIARLFSETDRTYVEYEDISPDVINAFLAVEDTRFFEHNGIDIVRIFGALLEDLKSGRIKQGASTISQQLVKVSSLTDDQTLSRKTQEMLMAFKLEQEYSKEEILELYLNYVNFGAGAYGIQTASQRYFGVDADELTLSQSALLAGIVKSPSGYAPHLNFQKSIQRRDLILDLMEENGFISGEECQQAKDEVISLDKMTKADAYPHGYYLDTALSEASQILGISYSEVLEGGYSIYTTMDSDVQEIAEEVMANPDNFPEDAADGVAAQGSLVVLNPKDSSIVAIMGGREHTVRQGFNRATDMQRQPGSTIKPIIAYAPAFEQDGYTTTTFLLDEAQDFDGYSPTSSKYHGWVTVRTALAKSLNNPALQTLETVGVENGKNYASNVGIPFAEEDTGLSLALGGFTYGVSPVNLCGAYVPFANGGYYKTPYSVSKIVDSSGNVVYANQENAYGVLSAETSFLISSVLQTCVEEGTAKNLKLENVPLSAKTGTASMPNSDKNKDAWVVAYNSQYAICAWVGFDTPDEDHLLEKGSTGGSYPTKIAKAMFSKIYSGKQGPELSVPSEIQTAKLDKLALEEEHEVELAPNYAPEEATVTEYFTQDTLPSDSYGYAGDVPSAPADFSISINQEGYPTLTFTPSEDDYITYKVMRKNLVNNNVAVVAQYPANGGPVSLTDYNINKEYSYCYYVVPYVAANDTYSQELQGAPSRSCIYTPNGVQTMEDLEQQETIAQ